MPGGNNPEPLGSRRSAAASGRPVPRTATASGPAARRASGSDCAGKGPVPGPEPPPAPQPPFSLTPLLQKIIFRSAIFPRALTNIPGGRRRCRKNKRCFFAIRLDFYRGIVIIIHVAIARLCKGSTTDSDSVCLGSNPSRATTWTLAVLAARVFPTGCGSAW